MGNSASRPPPGGNERPSPHSQTPSSSGGRFSASEAGHYSANYTPNPSLPTSSTTSSTHNTPPKPKSTRRNSVGPQLSKAEPLQPSTTTESATGNHVLPKRATTSASAHPYQSRKVVDTPPTSESSSLSSNTAAMGGQHSKEAKDKQAKVIVPSQPQAIPSAASSSTNSPRRNDSPVTPSAPPQYNSGPNHLPASQFTRPPRLPLPIEEEIHTPGSPIISPADVEGSLVERDIIGSGLPRRTSVLSNATAEDEEELTDEFGAYTIAGEERKTIPTVVEWKGTDEKVYVTGTFAHWSRKYRLLKR
jgi:hypothetical protein